MHLVTKSGYLHEDAINAHSHGSPSYCRYHVSEPTTSNAAPLHTPQYVCTCALIIRTLVVRHYVRTSVPLCAHNSVMSHYVHWVHCTNIEIKVCRISVSDRRPPAKLALHGAFATNPPFQTTLYRVHMDDQSPAKIMVLRVQLYHTLANKNLGLHFPSLLNIILSAVVMPSPLRTSCEIGADPT